MILDSWSAVVKVALTGVLAYVALLFLLRISGKRTLSKMNAFDWIVTVALGSTLASTILSKDVAVLEGVAALAVLVGLQYVITYLSVRSPTMRHIIKSEPALLFHQGEFLWQAMQRERVTENEIRAAVRTQGTSSMDAVLAVVLETDGSMSVVSQGDSDVHTAMKTVSNYPPDEQ